MARAASYYHSDSSTSCIVCGKSSRRNSTFRHHSPDLSDSSMEIPCHLRCYSLYLIGLWLRFILVAVSLFLLLRFLELGFIYQVFWKWGRLPVAWSVVNAVPALFSGAWAATRAQIRFQIKIDSHVQIHTFPLD